MQVEGQTAEGISAKDHDLLLTSASSATVTSSTAPPSLELRYLQVASQTAQIQCYYCHKIFSVHGIGGGLHVCPYCSHPNEFAPANGLIAVPVVTALPGSPPQIFNCARCLNNPCYLAAVIFYVFAAIVLIIGISLVASPPHDCSSNTNADNGRCTNGGASCCTCQYTGSRCFSPAPDPWIGIVVILVGFPAAVIIGAICNCCACWCWHRRQ